MTTGTTGGKGRAGGRPAAAGGRSAAPTDLAEFVGHALEESDAELRIVTIPAPVALPEPLLETAGPAIFWTTPGAPVHVGLGAARTIHGSGVERFRAVRDAAERLWPRVSAVTHAAASPITPRLFGGFSFLPGPREAEWRSFGEATFILPRLLYTVDEAGGRLSVAVAPDELDRQGIAAVVGEVEEMLGRLGAPGGPGGARTGSVREGAAAAGAGASAAAVAASAGDRAAWSAAVASIQDRIEAGRAEKIVAARSRAVPLQGAADICGILRRLDEESATAARFAFRLGDGVFLGATPERLVGRTGREVRTEALAGSISADTPEREAHLLASLKEGVEHEYVVRAIVEALEPLCERLEHPKEAGVQRLRHVLHLQTPITGRLRDEVHVLDLVERLHPTPAVGGWPKEEALEWIDREEAGSRGWYAAPVGWFDDRGDGEFGVALRSGLLHGGRAHLYAGAGIVAGSDAAAEYDETEVKLRTMMDALRVRP